MNPTNEAELIRKLVSEIMDSGLSAAQVCKGHPELLPAVERRWRQLSAIRNDLDTLFPAGKNKGAFGPSSLSNAPSLPGYEQVEFVGRGGMGVVYKARHTALNRIVAIKMLLPGSHDVPRETEVLLREASAVASIQHPNIVQVFDVGTFEGRPYFTMEFLDGGSLAQRMGGNPQPPHKAADLALILARAVQVAHEMGVVHRDLKPGNILFAGDGTPKIVDFGLARRIDETSAATLSHIGFGTPSYMAPEQALGAAGRNEPAVDVYALGAVLYDLLTGRAPFRADSPVETQRQVVEQDPAPPSQLNSRVPRDLETICLACLRKDPSRRYASAKAIADDLGRFIRGDPVSARPVGLAERLRKWIRRHPAHTAAWFAAVVCIAVAFGVALWTYSQRLAFEREVAADFAEVVRLERASDWNAARNVLERAKTRMGLGYGSKDLDLRAAQISRELDLVDRLSAMRSERAASSEIEFDRQKWWHAYRAEFIAAGLLREGDNSEAFAARVAVSNVKAALVDAMDDWTICATNKGNLEWLLAALRTADPDPAWRDRARTVAILQDSAALVALAREARIEDQRVPLMLIVAALLIENGEEEGLLFLRQIQAAHPSDFWACFGLAESLAGKDPEAIGFYRAAISLRPQAAAAHVNLAIALADQNRVAEAIERMQHAVRLDPRSNIAQHNLAIWLFRQQRFEEAAEHARLASIIDPNFAFSHGVRGSSLLRLGRAAEAAESFRRAISLLPEGHPQRESFGRAVTKCEELLSEPQHTGNP